MCSYIVSCPLTSGLVFTAPNKTAQSNLSRAFTARTEIFTQGGRAGAHVTGSDDGIVITAAASVLELSKRHREISQYGARKRPLLMTYSMLAL